MSDSILTLTKKALGIDESDDAFDMDIVMHINSVFMTLQQLGVGPSEGYSIEGKTDNWDDFTKGDKNLNSVKTYMYLRVRLLFDPPTSSFALDSFQKQINEFEWRINIQVDPPKPHSLEGL